MGEQAQAAEVARRQGLPEIRVFILIEPRRGEQLRAGGGEVDAALGDRFALTNAEQQRGGGPVGVRIARRGIAERARPFERRVMMRGHPGERFDALALVAQQRVDQGEALVRGPQQMQALGGVTEHAQVFELGNTVADFLDQRAGAHRRIFRTRHRQRLEARRREAHAVVRALLDDSDRRTALLGAQREVQRRNAFLPAARLAVVEAERRGDITAIAPPCIRRRHAREDGVDLLLWIAIVTAGLQPARAILQGHHQLRRSRERRRRGARHLPAAHEHEVRIAVALVGAPGVDRRMLAPGFLAREPHGFTKVIAGEHAGVEDIGERARGGIVHRPPGDDHRPRAHVDEGHAEVCRQTRAVERRRRERAAEMATIHEHEFGHPAQLLHIARRQEVIRPDHHAGHRGRTGRRGRRVVHPVAREMQDAPRPPVQLVENAVLLLVDGIEHFEAERAQGRGHLLRLLPRTGQIGVVGVIAECRVADDQRCRRVTVCRLLAKLPRLQLAQHAGLHRGRPRVLAPAVVEQFPGKTRRAGVQLQHDVLLLLRHLAQAQRQQHLEQRARRFEVRARGVRCLLDEALGEHELAGRHRFLGARAVGREDEAQRIGRRLLLDDFEALPPFGRVVEADAAAGRAALPQHAVPAHGGSERAIAERIA